MTPILTPGTITMHRPGPTQHQQWAVESRERTPGTDRPLWRYGRIEGPGTPWIVEYVPTGQFDQRGTRDAARRWTAADAAAFFRAAAARVLADGGAADGRVDARSRRAVEAPDAAAARVAAARRHLAIHDGLMLPAGGTNLPETECVCGGLLAHRAGRWLHTDTCWECCDTGWILPCPTTARHRLCPLPEPVPCEHPGCDRPSNLLTAPCAADRERCCSCCQEEG